MARRRHRLNINAPELVRIIGFLILVEAMFMSVPLLYSLITGGDEASVFAISIAANVVVGLGIVLTVKPRVREMGKRDGMLLTALVWVIFSLFGMLPFILCDIHLNVAEAFFESMSGFTTTGASVISDISDLPRGVNLWRCIMQWLGGVGIIIFTVALLPMLNSSGGMQMFNAEVTGITHEKLRPRISQTAKSLWAIYFVLTAMVFVLLWIGPMNFFDSLCHAFSTMSTGGFSTRNNSIADWDSNYVKVIVTIFMFLGGVNFALIFKAIHGDIKSLYRNDTFMTYVKIVVAAYVTFVIAIIVNGQAHTIEDVTIDPLFQIITTMSSTGLTASNFLNWGPFVMALLFILMFFGACAGSTSGGAKIDRLLFLLKNTGNELYRSVHPNAIRSVRINGNIVSPDVVDKVIAFLCIYVMIISVGGIVLTAFGLPIVDSFFNSFSCVSNIGLGADTTGMGGFAGMPDIAKWVLSFLMLTGRLEIFTVLILFTPAFWSK